MMAFIVLMLVLLSVSTSDTSNVTTTKTIGQKLDAKFRWIENYLKLLNMAHGGCAPCSKIEGTDDFCDCRKLEAKTDCLEFYQAGIKINGLYRLHSPSFNPRYVYCDQTTQGGGWTVIQRRKDGSENFFRNWNDYKIGFGNLKGEFWFGNKNINHLTNNNETNSLLINLKFPGESSPMWAMYSNFSVGDESTKYILHVSGFSSNNITDRLSQHNNMMFSTHDQDNDNRNTTHCAEKYEGGWWFNGCFHSHLNGKYDFGSPCMNVNWGPRNCTLRAKFSEMKVRRNIC